MNCEDEQLESARPLTCEDSQRAELGVNRTDQPLPYNHQTSVEDFDSQTMELEDISERSESRRKGLKKRFVDQFNRHSSDDNTPINESRGGFETHCSDDNTPRDEPACDDLNSNVDDSNRSDRKRQAPDDPLHVLPLQPALKRAKVNEKEPTSHDTLQYEGHQFTWKDDCKK